MDVRSLAKSVEAVNQIMQAASAKSTDMAKKIAVLNVEALVGKESGKGQAVDITA